MQTGSQTQTLKTEAQLKNPKELLFLSWVGLCFIFGCGFSYLSLLYNIDSVESAW